MKKIRKRSPLSPDRIVLSENRAGIERSRSEAPVHMASMVWTPQQPLQQVPTQDGLHGKREGVCTKTNPTHLTTAEDAFKKTCAEPLSCQQAPKLQV